MALIHIDAGDLRERLEVLELRGDGAGGWQWVSVRRTWGAAELSARKNVWSAHSIGAAGVTFTVRRQALTPGHALLWRGQHCFLTSILPLGQNHLTVTAALTEITACEDRFTGTTFPGTVTEPYRGHEQREPQAVNTIRRILVTPKQVMLLPGRPVRMGGTDWPITTAYLLEPWYNEYELERTADL